MDKHTVILPHNGILLRDSKEHAIDTHNWDDTEWKGITLNERNPLQKITHYILPFKQHFYKDQAIEMANRSVFARI